MKTLAAFILFFSILSNPAIAEVTEYDFELIIFEDTSGRYANSEQWQHELSEPDTESSTTGATSETQPRTTDANTTMNIRDIKGIGLNRYAKKLKANKRYNVLVHKAWRQTGLAEDAAIDMPIDSRQSNTVNSKNDINNIHGSIKIVLGRYLHIYTNMIYQQPLKDVTPAWTGQASQHKEYPINFHRRMRSKELHYLDHPMVGILVKAIPVEKKQDTSEKT